MLFHKKIINLFYFENIKKQIDFLAHFTLKTVELQLFLTGMSLPILLGWGLPISVVSWFATPLFAPLFSLFLLCSTFIFFSYFLYLPTWPVVWTMEQLCSVWLTVLSWYQQWWLIGFYIPHPCILVIPPFVMLAIMHYKNHTHILGRIFKMALFIVGYCLLLKMFQYAQEPLIVTIPCNGSYLTIISTHTSTICIDNGCLAKKAPNNAWIEYELLPTITKHTGKTCITHIICLQCSLRSLEIVKLLDKASPLTLIVIPASHGLQSLPYGQSLKEFKKNILDTNQQGKLILVDKKNQCTLNITDTLRLIIKNIGKDIASEQKTYLSLQMHNNMDYSILEWKALKSKKSMSKTDKKE